MAIHIYTHDYNRMEIIRDYYMTFSISGLVLARNSHSSPTAKLEGSCGSRVDTRDDMENFMS